MRRWAIYIDIEGTSALFEPRDWLHTHTNLMDEIVRKAKLRIAGAAELEEALRHYVASAEADDDWKHFTLCLNGVA
jgi:hypothetical protein